MNEKRKKNEGKKKGKIRTVYVYMYTFRLSNFSLFSRLFFPFLPLSGVLKNTPKAHRKIEHCSYPDTGHHHHHPAASPHPFHKNEKCRR